MAPRFDVEPWSELERLEINEYPWYQGGRRQRTTAAACYDDDGLHLIYRCEDSHIWAAPRKPNGAVALDSCVEFFARLPGDENYFNLEINCCGVRHLGYGPGRNHRDLCPFPILDRIEVATTVEGPYKEECPEDEEWTLRATLPFEVIEEFTGRETDPGEGERWRANFYRCGGRTDPQFACWSPIDAPSPDFHQPDYFGRLLFGPRDRRAESATESAVTSRRA
jgi:hypothetical protein